MIVFTLLSLVVGWWAASRVMSPVSELASRLRAYRATTAQPEPLAPHFPDDEVGQLAEALDDYARRLTEVVQRDREFNADVSHELRTPLAVISGATELLLSKPDLDDKMRAAPAAHPARRAAMHRPDRRAAAAVAQRARARRSTDVARVAEQLLDAHRAQLGGKPLDAAHRRRTRLVVDAPESAVVGRARQPDRQRGQVHAGGRGGGAAARQRVEVIDTGPGLSAEDAARLFERGYRGTHAGHSQGGGIGLSIVRRLCELYGWKVRVLPGEERGVVATLTFAAEKA